MDMNASMRQLREELDQESNPDFYKVDTKAAKLFETARAQSEEIAQAAQKEAQDAAAAAAADSDEFDKNGLARSKLAALQAQDKAQDDARNAAIAEEEAYEIGMMSMRETGLAMGDLLRQKLGK